MRSMAWLCGGWALLVVPLGCGLPEDSSNDAEVDAPVMSQTSLPRASKTPLYYALEAHVREQVLPAVSSISAERRQTLAELAAFVTAQHKAGQPAALTFICTHNSRRSQMGQVWAATAAAWFGLDEVQTFSGGTETTAFNPRAVAALRRAGFQIDDSDGDNPRYTVRMGADVPGQACFSKHYGDAHNPAEGFAAVMTCSAADASCPTVQGAALRVGLPYDDPKVADDTPQQRARYDERSRQIAAEMFFLMSLVER